MRDDSYRDLEHRLGRWHRCRRAREPTARHQVKTFMPYEGWEDDLEGLLAAFGGLGSVGVDEKFVRLLAAFEPDKCGKVLLDGPVPVQLVAYEPSGIYVVCNLPAGHHPFENDVLNRCAHAVSNGRQCRKLAGDPIHSPGHVPDVPESSWR